MKKILMFAILGMFLFSLVPMINAENIGDFAVGETFEITNYCISADCTYMNLTSITSPSGNVTYYNVEMTQTGQEFNYTYTAGAEQGLYRFKTCADPREDPMCEEDTFYVGQELTTALAIAFVGLVSFLFLLFLLCLVSIFKLDNFIAVFTMFWVTYLLFFAITFICYQLTDSYFINVEFLGTFFWIIYWILLIATFPLLLSSMAYLFYIIIYNDHFKKLVEKGMTPEEAFKYNDKKINPFSKGGRR